MDDLENRPSGLFELLGDQVSDGRGSVLKHNESIAQLRGVAVSVVVLMHYLLCFPISYAGLSFIWNGYYGASLFFAISGFLITSNMIARYGEPGSVDLRAFYDMRAARILPCLGLVVTILTVIALTTQIDGITFPNHLSPGTAIISLLTLRFNDYYVHGASGSPAWAVLWSISIEEAFYLAYPIVAIMLRKNLLLVALLAGIAIYGPFERDSILGLYSYFGCFDLIAMGALAAIAASHLRGRLSGPALQSLTLAGATLVIVTYLTLNVREHYTIGPSLIGLGASLMLFASAFRQGSEKKTILGKLGSLSYEIYLFHLMVFILLAKVIPATNGPLAYLVWAGVMLALYLICAAIAAYFSVPLNAYIRARLAPSERRLTSPAIPLRDAAVSSEALPRVKIARG
jgi:peptidoglycan/LPS O-acetylase OafA/YrhL